MHFAIQELSNEVAKITLEGRFDVEAAMVVDQKMNLAAGNNRLVLIDMANVTFLGSMGVRTLYTMARTLQGRGGRLSLLSTNDEVTNVLTVSGITARASLFTSESSAHESLRL